MSCGHLLYDIVLLITANCTVSLHQVSCFGALFGSHLDTVDFGRHIPPSWTSTCTGLHRCNHRMTSNNVDVVEEPPMTMVREVITMPYKGREEELD